MSETISDEVKAEVMAGLEKICKEKVPDGAKWAEVGDGSNHSDICRSIMSDAMDYLIAYEGIKGYKFFVKATMAQINGFAQCATTYWTPDAMDLSVNVTNAENVLVICTAYAASSKGDKGGGSPLPDEVKAEVTGKLESIATAATGEKKWAEVGGEEGKHSDVCRTVMGDAMDSLIATEGLKGYKFFVKATMAQINGFAQCATTYWTPDAMDLSVNVTNAENVLVICTSYASQ